MKKVIMLLLSGIVLLGVSPNAQGAGFLIYEHGAAAMAMGGAWVGVANNPTAIFHNPAGLAWLDGTQVSLGTTLITETATLSLPNWPDPTYQTNDLKKKWFFPSTFYISHKLSDRITAGFGFFSPYGLGLEWDEDYPLKYISVKDDMKTFFFNPAVAVKVSENFSLGMGVSYVYATVALDRVERLDLHEISPLLPSNVLVFDIPTNLEGNGSSFSLNAGALYRGENFSLGFNWRGGFALEFEGDLKLDTSGMQIPFPYNLFIDPSVIPTTGDGKTTFNFPHILGAGAAFNLTEKLLLTVDVHYVLWGTFKELVIEVEGIPGFEKLEIEENWEDSFVFRGGFQYQVNESFALRAGALYDQTPQPVETMDSTLPDSDRWALTGGFGYKSSGGFEINVAYQYERFKERTSPNRNIYLNTPIPGVNLGEGPYKVTAHLIGISLGYNF